MHPLKSDNDRLYSLPQTRYVAMALSETPPTHHRLPVILCRQPFNNYYVPDCNSFSKLALFKTIAFKMAKYLIKFTLSIYYE